MARKTNKTDHVLNLLSSGAKKTPPKKEESDAPPVDLRPKKPAAAAEPEEMIEEIEPVAAPDQGDEERAIGAPSFERDVELRDVDSPDTERTTRTVRETVSRENSEIPSQASAPQPQTVQVIEPPKVSVVHTAEEDNAIADAVKNSLEAELDAYMDEKIKQGEPEFFVELKDTSEVSPTEIESVPEEELVDVEYAELKTEAILEERRNVTPLIVDVKAAMAHHEEPEEEEIEEQKITPEPEKTLDAGEIQTEEAAEPQAVAEPPSVPAMEEEVPQQEKDYTMVNVMEYLVRDQVPKYVRQFGHCDCDRCLEDTIALTLTHLPAKYVVVNKNAVSPLLNFYEKRYAGQLIVEITKATMIVNESPNH